MPLTVRDVNLDGAPSSLRAVILHAPWAHPVWDSYFVSCIHLRPVDGWPDCQLEHRDSTHEFCVMALDPEYVVDPLQPKSIHTLKPPNLVWQMRSGSDESARRLFDRFVVALSKRELSPDTDFRQRALRWLAATAFVELYRELVRAHPRPHPTLTRIARGLDALGKAETQTMLARPADWTQPLPCHTECSEAGIKLDWLHSPKRPYETPAIESTSELQTAPVYNTWPREKLPGST